MPEMRYARSPIMRHAVASGWARLTLLAGLALPLLAGPPRPECFGCCPRARPAETTLSSVGCCGQDCGASLEKGAHGSCALACRGAAGLTVTLGQPAFVFQTAPASQSRAGSVFLAASPPAARAAPTLRL